MAQGPQVIVPCVGMVEFPTPEKSPLKLFPISSNHGRMMLE
jgi:hypothetical protein